MKRKCSKCYGKGGFISANYDDTEMCYTCMGAGYAEDQIPLAIKDAAIMVYPNARVKGSGPAPSWEITAYSKDKIRLHMAPNISEEERWVSTSNYKLILRPVSSLTDEECIEVARILIPFKGEYTVVRNGSHPTVYGAPYSIVINDHINNVDPLFICYFQHVVQSTIHADVSAVTDYLRSINVLTTVHGFNLVEQGIAILETTKNETNELERP